MLTQLSIRDYAIVDALEIDFEPGMTVITGETGAGKSIILGALGLTLGDRADKTVVRNGAKRSDVSACFELGDDRQARAWLLDHDLVTDGEQPATCLLRRVVNGDGGSRAYINGTPVTLGNLTELGDMLMDIHSQHEHQSLLRKATHQRLLDEFGADPQTLRHTRDYWQQWQHNQDLIRHLSEESQELTAQMQLISYQVAELDEVAPEEGECQALELEFQRLDNADNTQVTLQQVLTLCQDDENFNVRQAIGQAQTLLDSMSTHGLRLDNVRELLDTAAIQIEEAAGEIQDQLDLVESNPERLEWVNGRLATLHRVARKHKVKPAELPALHQSLRQKCDQFQNSDLKLDRLERQDRELRVLYGDVAGQLSRQRNLAAKKLAAEINRQLADLGMADARLEVKLTTTAGDEPSAHGLESVEFMISTNPGQPAKPLAKIASGGELSRVSLAIQVVTARTSRTPTLVFDEVDVGIGGGVARSVGKLLRHLGEHAQVLCVTHQAQVASQGHQHLVVRKKTTGKATRTTLARLSDEEKIKEIARMLGGEQYSDESLAHAEQMVANE